MYKTLHISFFYTKCMHITASIWHLLSLLTFLTFLLAWPFLWFNCSIFELTVILLIFLIPFLISSALGLTLTRCTTCTAKGTWNSADYLVTFCSGVWSRGLCTLWRLKLAPQPAAHAPHLSTSPQLLLHLPPSPHPNPSLLVQTVCHSAGALPLSQTGPSESIFYLGEVWRMWGGGEVRMKRVWKEER